MMKLEMKDVYEALTIVVVIVLTMVAVWGWTAWRNRRRSGHPRS